MQSRNLAARAGRWSAKHLRAAILGWLAFVVVSVMLGGALGMKEIASEDLGDGESKRADQILADGFPDRASEEVLVQGRGNVKADDPRFTAAVPLRGLRRPGGHPARSGSNAPVGRRQHRARVRG